MVRANKFLAICVAAVSVTAAAAAKEDVRGFNGVTFGTKFGTAKKQLGSSARADRDPEDATLKTLLAHAELYGEKFNVNYSFDHAETFVAAYAIADVPTGDYAVCKSHWDKVRDGLVATFGIPTNDTDRMSATIQSESIAFKFDNGNRLEASILGCLISVDFLSRKAE